MNDIESHIYIMKYSIYKENRKIIKNLFRTWRKPQTKNLLIKRHSR